MCEGISEAYIIQIDCCQMNYACVAALMTSLLANIRITRGSMYCNYVYGVYL